MVIRLKSPFTNYRELSARSSDYTAPNCFVCHAAPRCLLEILYPLNWPDNTRCSQKVRQSRLVSCWFRIYCAGESEHCNMGRHGCKFADNDVARHRSIELMRDGIDRYSHPGFITRLLENRVGFSALTFLLSADGFQIHESNTKSA